MFNPVWPCILRLLLEPGGTADLPPYVDYLSKPATLPSSMSTSTVFAGLQRHLQPRRIQVLTNKRDICKSVFSSKAFLAGVPKTMYADLRASVNMLNYIAHVRKLLNDQRAHVAGLAHTNEALTQDIDRLKASFEALKIEKRRIEQNLQTVSSERDGISAEYNRIHEQLTNVEGQLVLMTEQASYILLRLPEPANPILSLQNETSQNQLVLLNEELHRLRQENEFSSPEGDSPADIPDYPPDVSQANWPQIAADPSAPFLTPWENVMKTKLPDGQDPMPPPDDNAVPKLCGAAGCPHSCDCMPFLLFSPGAQARAAAVNMARFGTSSFHSGISLSFQEHHRRSRSHSRSRSRPRSRSLSRASSPLRSSPTTVSTSHPSPPEGMSMSINIPTSNPHAQVLRGRLQDLLSDPVVSSSLPNMPTMHAPSSPSPLSREFKHAPSSSQRVSGAPISHENPLPISPPTAEPERASSGKAKDSSRTPPYPAASSSKVKEIHPPMLYASGLSRERPTVTKSRTHPPMVYGSPSATTSMPAESAKPPLYRSSSGSSSTDSSRTLTDKERRRAEKAAARIAPHPPMMLPPSPSRLTAPTVSGLRLPSPASGSFSSGNGDGRVPAPPVVHAASAQAYLQGQVSASQQPRAQAHANPPSAANPTTNNSNNNNAFTVLDQHIKQTERDVIAAYDHAGNPRPQHHAKPNKRIPPPMSTMQMAAASALYA
ncbi:RING-type domain-containing protein [Mycena indigotica]|uniref:RING-type domain-containing protein n=1 Tax=Mycena indigotica TaxID=2126181 RepID=A0A8H6VZ61_9AGAR|nr:RING-type domain-containing protein [Mycena indigotica]KAF7299162.1 RING-type domain-containing protein [Mycena indigotica]